MTAGVPAHRGLALSGRTRAAPPSGLARAGRCPHGASGAARKRPPGRFLVHLLKTAPHVADGRAVSDIGPHEPHADLDDGRPLAAYRAGWNAADSGFSNFEYAVEFSSVHASLFDWFRSGWNDRMRSADARQ